MKNFQLLSKLSFLQNLLSLILSVIPPPLIHNFSKYGAIKKALYLTGLDGTKGDYIEFGVFTGSSFSCALQCANKIESHNSMQFIGFDSFDGFGEVSDKDKHPFFTKNNFQTNYNKVNKRVHRLAKKYQKVTLVKGFFSDTCKNNSPSTYDIGKASIIMIDCDMHDPALDCFEFITPALQEGTILILDDAFSYKGSENQGVYGAFLSWNKNHPEYYFRRISSYGLGGELYIVSSTEIRSSSNVPI